MKENDIENIPNTFAPNVKNKVFSLNALVFMTMRGFVRQENIPMELREKISAELERRLPQIKTGSELK